MEFKLETSKVVDGRGCAGMDRGVWTICEGELSGVTGWFDRGCGGGGGGYR